MKLRWSDVAAACPALAQSGTALDREQAMHRAHVLAAEELGRPLAENDREAVARLSAALHAEALGQDPRAHGFAPVRGPADRAAPAPRAQSEVEALRMELAGLRSIAETNESELNARTKALLELGEVNAAIIAKAAEWQARAENAERKLAELEAQQSAPAPVEEIPAPEAPTPEGPPAEAPVEPAPRSRRR